MLAFLIILAADNPAVPAAPEQSAQWTRLPTGGISLLVALLAGLAISFAAGKLMAALLRKRRFDDLFTPPWKPATSGRKAGQWNRAEWNATTIVSWAGSATVMVLLIWGYAQYHGYSHPFIVQMMYLCGQVWMLLLTILVALGIAKVVAGAVLSIFNNQTVRRQLELFCPHTPHTAKDDHVEEIKLKPQHDELADVTDADVITAAPIKEEAHQHAPARETSPVQDESMAESGKEPPVPDAGETEQESRTSDLPDSAGAEKTEAFADTIARLVGLLVYLIVFLPVFMIAAEIWSWSDTSNAISDVWGWLIPLVGLAAIILLGWFALTAAVIAVIPASQRRSVMIVTTVLALVVLVASYNAVFAIIFSVALVIFAWITRNDLPDALAGWYLKSQSNLSAKTPLGAGKIVRVQLLTSDIKTVNGSFRVRNRHVLRCYLDGTMIAESRMVPIDQDGNPIMPEKQDSGFSRQSHSDATTEAGDRNQA